MFVAKHAQSILLHLHVLEILYHFPSTQNSKELINKNVRSRRFSFFFVINHFL